MRAGVEPTYHVLQTCAWTPRLPHQRMNGIEIIGICQGRFCPHSLPTFSPHLALVETAPLGYHYKKL